MKRSLIAAVVVCAGAGFSAGTAAAQTIAPADVVIEDMTISQSLTGVPGDPANGRKVFANRKKGNCLACHQNPDLSELLFHGEIGPSLEEVGDRYDEAFLRALLVNAKAIFEDTLMPAFYVDNATLRRVSSKFDGKTILTAQEVEDVIAYLMTLK